MESDAMDNLQDDVRDCYYTLCKDLYEIAQSQGGKATNTSTRLGEYSLAVLGDDIDNNLYDDLVSVFIGGRWKTLSSLGVTGVMEVADMWCY